MILYKNIYVVLTEYQFLQALNIATSIYNSSEYLNQIYIIRNEKRLLSLDISSSMSIDNIKITVFDKKEPREIADYLLKENPDHFLFFQAISPLNIHLAYTLSKKGVKISLGPDGYGAYAKFNKKHHLLSIIKDSYKDNVFMFRNRLRSLKIHKFDYYTYGNQNFIDNVWVTHPEQYVHRAKNKVIIKKLPYFSQKCIAIIKDCFKFKDDFPCENVIYFFNQPLWGLLADKELQFLKDVINTFPQTKVIVKLHPLTAVKMKENYKAMHRLDVLDSSAPAEVILLSLKNCIVFSGWSSVLITENKNCNYYFNYPVFKKMGDPILNQMGFTFLNHIDMIETPQEMKFPNE